MKQVLWVIIMAASAFAAEPYTVWNEHLGGIGSAQYSALKQIDRSNVTRLDNLRVRFGPG